MSMILLHAPTLVLTLVLTCRRTLAGILFAADSRRLAACSLLCLAPALAASPAMAQNPFDPEAMTGRYVMLLDEVTSLELREDGTFVYEDPMEAFGASYAWDGRELVCDFSSYDWYFGQDLRCEPEDNATLSCSDGERYRREDALPPERVFGKYVHEENPEISISLQRDMEYFYATPEGICTYRFDILDEQVHVFLWDCECLGEGTLVCTPDSGTLDCSNDVIYVRR